MRCDTISIQNILKQTDPVECMRIMRKLKDEGKGVDQLL